MNKKYNELQEEIERLTQNANYYAGLESSLATDKHLAGRTAQIAEMASRIADFAEKADAGFGEDPAKVEAAALELATKKLPKRHVASVSSIGQVNTCSGFNANFGTIWNVWAENKFETNILVEREGKFKLIHTSGNCTEISIKVGDTLELKQDQTQAQMGTWNVVAYERHTKEGLQNLGARAGKKSIPSATFK